MSRRPRPFSTVTSSLGTNRFHQVTWRSAFLPLILLYSFITFFPDSSGWRETNTVHPVTEQIKSSLNSASVNPWFFKCMQDKRPDASSYEGIPIGEMHWSRRHSERNECRWSSGSFLMWFKRKKVFWPLLSPCLQIPRLTIVFAFNCIWQMVDGWVAGS